MKKEFFTTGFNLDKNSLINLRTAQGFKIKNGIDYGTYVVVAEMKDFLSSFKITTKFYSSGNEHEFNFYEVIPMRDLLSFLKQFLTPLPEEVRFKHSDRFRVHALPAFYLPNGNILAVTSYSSTSWFSLSTIPKDMILS